MTSRTPEMIAVVPVWQPVPRPEGRAPNCPDCGRFMIWNGSQGYYQCRKAFRVCDADGGGWEHD